jgi:hypothetical protein
MKSEQIFPDQQPKPGLGDRFKDWVKETHLSQGPVLAENAKAAFRNGREDILNTLWGSNLNREPGDFATPTQTMVNQEMGIVPEIDEQRSIPQQRERSR